MFKRIWNDERGVILPLFIILIPIMGLMFSFMVEMGRVNIFKHELQAIADASALAATTMTRSVPVYKYDPAIDDYVIDHYRKEMNPYHAAIEARVAYSRNKALLSKTADSRRRVISFNGYTKNDKKTYHAEITGEIELWFLNSWLLGDKRGPLTIVREAEADVRDK